MARGHVMAGVAVATAVALAATWWPRDPALLLPAVPAPTLLAWTAQISPLAGDGVAGLREGDAAQARFADPWSLLALNDGSVLVADGGDNSRLRVLQADGRLRTFAGGAPGFSDGPALQARFDTPSALARGRDGSVYVADTGNHAIRRIDRHGRVSTLAGGQQGFADGSAAQARFDAPMGVAVDAHGRVFVADTWNDRIRVIEPDGQVRTLAGGSGPGHADGVGEQARFDTPVAVALDNQGRLLVADFHNNAVRRLHMDGRVETVLSEGGAINGPLSLLVTHDDVLYVGDHAGRIVQVSAQGHQVALVGNGRIPRMARVSGLAMADGDTLLVADAASSRLHRVAPVPVGSAPAPALVGPAADAPLPDTGGRWPLAPQHRWHEVVGTLGEVRGNFRGESRHHLHGGFDIRGDVGQTVLAIAAGRIDTPAASWTVGGQAEGLAVGPLRYIHMQVGRDPRGVAFDGRWQQLRSAEGRLQRIRLRRGTRIAVGDRLGSINNQAHVHLSVGTGGFERNAAALGFTGFVDAVPPRIVEVSLLDDTDVPLPLQADGSVVVPRGDAGVQIVVDAWDQVDGNLPRRRLAPYQVGYQILDAQGTPLQGYETPRWNIVFNRMPPQPEAAKVAYAPDSGITVHGAAATRFRFLVTNTVRDGVMQRGRWHPGALPAGTYRIRASARDHSGNEAVGARERIVTLLP